MNKMQTKLPRMHATSPPEQFFLNELRILNQCYVLLLILTKKSDITKPNKTQPY